MEKEQYEEACPKFEESLRLDAGMGTQFNLAHCWEKLGRTASAWALFLDVAAAARAANQPQRETAARERAKALEPKLSRLRIDVPDPAEEMKIERDGLDVGEAMWGTAVPVDPGVHVIEVRAPGKKKWSDEIRVSGSARTMSIKVPPLEDAPLPTPETNVAGGANPPPVEADLAPRGGGTNGQTVAALIVGGVGLAAAATGTVFALQSRSDNAAALELCREPSPEGFGCRSDAERDRHSELVNAAKRERLIGFVGLGVGGAALVTAIILYATADDGMAEAGAYQVAPMWADGVPGAALVGHF